MNIFVGERQGTPITLEERQYLKSELAKLENAKSPEKLDASTQGMIDLCGYWNPSLELMCIDHDIAMIQRTLDTGVVWVWESE